MCYFMEKILMRWCFQLAGLWESGKDRSPITWENHLHLVAQKSKTQKEFLTNLQACCRNKRFHSLAFSALISKYSQLKSSSLWKILLCHSVAAQSRQPWHSNKSCLVLCDHPEWAENTPLCSTFTLNSHPQGFSKNDWMPLMWKKETKWIRILSITLI